MRGPRVGWGGAGVGRAVLHHDNEGVDAIEEHLCGDTNSEAKAIHCFQSGRGPDLVQRDMNYARVTGANPPSNVSKAKGEACSGMRLLTAKWFGMSTLRCRSSKSLSMRFFATLGRFLLLVPRSYRTWHLKAVVPEQRRAFRAAWRVGS